MCSPAGLGHSKRCPCGSVIAAIAGDLFVAGDVLGTAGGTGGTAALRKDEG